PRPFWPSDALVLLPCLANELCEQVERCDRGQRVWLNLAQSIHQRMPFNSSKERKLAVRCARRSTSPSSRRGYQLLTLEKFQQDPRAFNDWSRQSREPPNLDSIGSICSSRLEPMKKEDVVPRFPDIDAVVPNRSELVCQLRQLMIVRREHGFAANLLKQVLAHRPGDADAVPCARPTADFIEQYKATYRSRVQDCACFRHLHHERGLSSHQVITRPHPCEYSVRDPDLCTCRGDETPGLCHQDNQPELSQYRAFPRHIRPCQNDHPRIG